MIIIEIAWKETEGRQITAILKTVEGGGAEYLNYQEHCREGDDYAG